MVKEKDIKYLFSRYCNQLSTREEYESFMQIIANAEHDIRLKNLLEELYLEMELADFTGRIEHSEIVKVTKVKLWPRIAGIAAAVAAIVLGIWIFTTPRHTALVPDTQIVHNDIAPGKNAATITLANGKTITLSDAKSGVVINNTNLTYNDGTAINASGSAGELIRNQTISTPRGGTYQITLSDGTKVWLNAASSLTYTATINEQGQRKVKLEGEAYFEVSKDKVHPFIVESKGQEVEVLGTHFNVRTYPGNEGVKTTLLEGSVKVKTDKSFAVLKPNHQALLTNQSIKITEIDAKEAIAWKEGYFRFNDASIESVMLELSRWYNVEVVYQGEITRDGFNGKISRFKNISEALKMLENTDLVHFKVEGRRVIVLR